VNGHESRLACEQNEKRKKKPTERSFEIHDEKTQADLSGGRRGQLGHHTRQAKTPFGLAELAFDRAADGFVGACLLLRFGRHLFRSRTQWRTTHANAVLFAERTVGAYDKSDRHELILDSSQNVFDKTRGASMLDCRDKITSLRATTERFSQVPTRYSKPDKALDLSDEITRLVKTIPAQVIQKRKAIDDTHR